MIVKTIETMFRAMSDAERLATVAMITRFARSWVTFAGVEYDAEKSGWKRSHVVCRPRLLDAYRQGYRHVQEGYVSDRR